MATKPIKLPFEQPTNGKLPWELSKKHPWWAPEDDPFYIPLALNQSRWTKEHRAELKRRTELHKGLHHVKRQRPRLPHWIRDQQERQP